MAMMRKALNGNVAPDKMSLFSFYEPAYVARHIIVSSSAAHRRRMAKMPFTAEAQIDTPDGMKRNRKYRS